MTREVFSSKEVKAGYRLEEFDMVKTVGTGSFSNVCLCLHKPTSRYAAMKILPLRNVIKLKQVQHVMNEKNILKEISHPFLISLTWSYKDLTSLYLMFPFMCGGELFTYLRMSGKFSTNTALFYTAEIVSAFSYLHSRHIVYRDLKPENILLDKEGHIVITDFGFSKKVPDITWTLCGTPEYLAPEIIKSKGHNKAVDWWALGVLLYEMLTGYPPFSDENPFIIYEKILAGRITWPPQVDDNAKDLIKKLLEPDRTKRLGNMKLGAEDVKNHEFFQSLDWANVYHKQLPPPIVPNIKSENDTRNFNNYVQCDNQLGQTEPVSETEFHLFDNF